MTFETLVPAYSLRFLKDWRTWISGPDDPLRPTENAAFKNLRDIAVLLEYKRLCKEGVLADE